VSSGFGIDVLFTKIAVSIAWAGKAIEENVDQRVWQSWVPRGLRWAAVTLSTGAAFADRWIVRALDRGVERATDVPAKVLQLIQSGDVQWYVLFGIGSVVAMLIHFLRFP
jgi:hypothetical protein